MKLTEDQHLHRQRAHPAFEYCMTEPPVTYPNGIHAGDGWTVNVWRAEHGREWMSTCEATHWHRRLGARPRPPRVYRHHPETLGDLLDDAGIRHHHHDHEVTFSNPPQLLTLRGRPDPA